MSVAAPPNGAKLDLLITQQPIGSGCTQGQQLLPHRRLHLELSLTLVDR